MWSLVFQRSLETKKMKKIKCVTFWLKKKLKEKMKIVIKVLETLNII